MEFVIENMQEHHIKAVAELEKMCFSQPWSEVSLREELDKITSKFLVAINEDGQVIGYVGFNFVLDEGYITNIAVSENCRKCGVAKKMMREIVGFANGKELRFVSLEVRKSNVAAISLYEKMGFSQVGKRKNFYVAPIEDALIMTKFLK